MISIKLDYHPLKIKAPNSIICVKAVVSQGIKFYNLNEFVFIRSYKHEIGRISQINSCVYEFSNETETVYCYDENGILKEEITLTDTDDILTDLNDGSLIRMDESIIMTSYSKKKIITFSINRK